MNMKKTKRIHQIKFVFALLYLIFVLYALQYQVKWQNDQENRLTVRQEMQKNGNGDLADPLLREAEYFPVRKDPTGHVEWSFEDGYGGERTYGGNRLHEGIDIMASEDRPGCLQICAMADGVVEQMGWLELGGYRIGIRSKSGFYYYYAHMAEYADHIQVGDVVKAGTVLGKMGNTGYGSEGTTGMFPVHLHFGIYTNVGGKEQSMNPYPLLQYLEGK
ncbi:MAG: M23 family metallopeptidase [Lachnospiraceae bacterium]|nr:M23 family metallopeptidase [Lachnospiraceae bacterium]